MRVPINFTAHDFRKQNKKLIIGRLFSKTFIYF